MGINIKQLPDSSAGLEGTDLNNGEFVYVNIPYNTASPLTLSSFVASRKMVVQAIYGLPDTASSNAVTGTVYKASSGTALGSGTALHSGTYNLQGTAATNQSLTLSTTTGVTTLNQGQRLGVVISGALGAAGSGIITVGLTPA